MCVYGRVIISDYMRYVNVWVTQSTCVCFLQGLILTEIVCVINEDTPSRVLVLIHTGIARTYRKLLYKLTLKTESSQCHL